MSYEIVYDRQFVKLDMPNYEEPWILPLTLHGSNNCTELSSSGKERRVRNWSGLYFNGQNQLPIEAPQAMMGKINSFCGGEYQQHFKRNGKYVDDAGLVRFFENGIKSAKTLEELNEISQLPIYLRCYLSVWNKHDNTAELQIRVNNSEELLQFLLEAKSRIRNRVEGESIYVQIQFPGDKAVPYPKEIKKRTKREFEDSYWVLREPSRRAYIEKLTARRILFTSSSTYCRKFATEKESLNWVEEKIKPKFGDRINLVPEEVII